MLSARISNFPLSLRGLMHDRENLGFALSRASRRWKQLLDTQLKPEGITYATWVTLVYLQRVGEGITQKRLAEEMQIESPSLVSHLDYLEREGLIERRTSQQDRRAKTLHLASKARPLLDTFDRVAGDTRQQLLAGISDTDIRVCLRVMQRIIDNSSHSSLQAEQ